ncbi:MAG: hypothetical protein A3D74_00505 [Candidatus Levybacteria bacterium RIFCSPHIGHO2_02_FULL_37_13]|nr:MAG: hypothetical protein A3D74_00505 [Candidatus Levybacteria bacterium RIFCSPHIGHO2_02_FULL_37_13]OGH29525.1 MAG: hypothetical protein A3E40_00380 [Candidatus Levybacteria bacterium RIFCSPHIGHO2_12_FULL_37_9]OGH39672.1 MAG: hypothetical protein A3B41_00930 [Candidatus Levybacteria bacterium RIFCSPLOWO2_01_FULL_37_26]
MLIVIKKHATKKEIEEMAKDLDGFVKVVVDIERKILTGGGERHVDGEQRLLQEGSHQKDLWGGGFDLETNEIDYNSIINLRPSQNNPSRDVLSSEIREDFDKIVKDLLL